MLRIPPFAVPHRSNHMPTFLIKDRNRFDEEPSRCSMQSRLFSTRLRSRSARSSSGDWTIVRTSAMKEPPPRHFN